MDFNKEYAAHQHALMRADNSASREKRRAHLDHASMIADRISAFQRKLGATATFAWYMPQA